MNKITVNKLTPVKNINVDKIMQDYDLFQIRIDGNFYPSRNALLSVNKSEDSILKQIVALDYLVIDDQKVVHCLCKKDSVSRDQLLEALTNYNQNLFDLHKLNKEEILNLPQAALLQLFFNQIQDFQILRGTSLVGKLYLLGNRRQLQSETLYLDEFSLDKNLVAQISTRVFTQIKYFVKNDVNLESKRYRFLPRYKIDKTGKISLIASGWQENEDINLYIQRPPFKNKKPKTSKFFITSAHDRYANFVKSKSGILYRIVDLFNEQFSQYFSKVAFKSVEAESKKPEFSKDKTTKNLKEKICAFTQNHELTWINKTDEKSDLFENIKKRMIGLGMKISQNKNAKYKIILIHSPEYYQKNNLPDPHISSLFTQHLTVEKIADVLDDKEGEAALYNAVKELIIKHDIEQKKLSLYPCDEQIQNLEFFTLIKNKDSDDIVYVVKFNSDQTFKIRKLGINDLDNPFNALLPDEKKKIELIIKDNINDSYFKIEKTALKTIPNEEYSIDIKEFTNHKRVPFLTKNQIIETVKKIDGLTNGDKLIELVKNNKEDKVSYKQIEVLLALAELKKRQQAKVLHLLTEDYGLVLRIDNRNEWARLRYLNGLTDINFWHKNGILLYNVGTIGNGMNMTVNKASVVRKISPIELLNEGKDTLSNEDILKLINMMLVSFVKYGDLTVLPFPEKYLKEYVYMEK